MANSQIDIVIKNAISGDVIEPMIEERDPNTVTLRNLKDAIIAGNQAAREAVANGSRIKLFHEEIEIGDVNNRTSDSTTFTTLGKDTDGEQYTIDFVVVPPGPMTITLRFTNQPPPPAWLGAVTTLDLGQITITGASKEDTVGDLKYSIYRKEGLPMTSVRLYKGHTLLENNANTLESYGIVNNAEQLYIMIGWDALADVAGAAGAGGGGGGGLGGGRRKTRRRGRGKTRGGIPNVACAAAGWYKNEKCEGEEDPYNPDGSIGPLQGLCGYGNKCYARNTILKRINKGGPIRFGGSEGAAKEGLITTEKINNLFKGGRRRKTRRRRRRKKRTRRQRRRRIGNDKRQLKRVVAQYRRFKIAQGDKRFKKTKGLVKCTRVSKGKRTARIYHRRKCRKNERRLSH